MTEAQSPAQTDAEADDPAGVGRLPIGIRLLGMIGFAALLVAVFALVRSEPESLPVGTGSVSPPGINPPSVGVAAPDFSVATMSGGRFTLSDHLATDGRPVFLNFWGSWCFPCTREMPHIEEAAVRNPGVMFIGVAIREPEAPAREFAEKLGVTYEIGFDDDGVVEELWDIWPMPETYLIGSGGIIRERIFVPMQAGDADRLVAETFGL